MNLDIKVKGKIKDISFIKLLFLIFLYVLFLMSILTLNLALILFIKDKIRVFKQSIYYIDYIEYKMHVEIRKDTLNFILINKDKDYYENECKLNNIVFNNANNIVIIKKYCSINLEFEIEDKNQYHIFRTQIEKRKTEDSLKLDSVFKLDKVLFKEIKRSILKDSSSYYLVRFFCYPLLTISPLILFGAFIVIGDKRLFEFNSLNKSNINLLIFVLFISLYISPLLTMIYCIKSNALKDLYFIIDDSVSLYNNILIRDILYSTDSDYYYNINIDFDNIEKITYCTKKEYLIIEGTFEYNYVNKYSGIIVDSGLSNLQLLPLYFKNNESIIEHLGVFIDFEDSDIKLLDSIYI